MALKRYSAFYYGHTVEDNNSYINFRDAGTGAALQYSGIVDVGSYTLTGFGNKVAQALNEVGSQIYTVTLDRVTRRFTISAPNNFELLISTGNQKTLSVFQLLGFTGLNDLTGSNTYTADSPSGEAYITQTPLKNFSDFNKNKEKNDATVRTTASGLTEVISYSTLERLKCDLPLITNITPQRFIRETNTGVEEAEAFMDYAISKAPLEFVYDFTDPFNFVPCILDRTGSNSKGVGYELREKVRQALPFYYELNGLVFLKIEDRD
jgi:hypothetical protein